MDEKQYEGDWIETFVNKWVDRNGGLPSHAQLFDIVTAAIAQDRKEREGPMYVISADDMDDRKVVQAPDPLAANLERLNTNRDRWTWEPLGGLYLVPKEERPGEGHDTPLAAVAAAIKEIGGE
jgi:hypothetical protein